MRIQSFPLFCIIRAPSGIRSLRAIAGAPPVPLTAVTEENIHAQFPLDVYLESVQSTGTASPFHFVSTARVDRNVDLDILRQGG